MSPWSGSEPVTDYIRFEYAITGEVNVSAGEDVRWLPRRQASDLCLPGNDFWLFDGELVRFSYFSGAGHILEDELVSDLAVTPDVLADLRGGLETLHPACRVPADLTSRAQDPPVVAISPSSSVQRAPGGRVRALPGPVPCCCWPPSPRPARYRWQRAERAARQ